MVCAQRAVASEPENADYRDTLAVLYLKRGLSRNAFALLNSITQEQPARGEVTRPAARGRLPREGGSVSLFCTRV